MSLACLLLSFNLLSRCETLCLVSSLAGGGGGDRLGFNDPWYRHPYFLAVSQSGQIMKTSLSLFLCRKHRTSKNNV